MKRKLLYFKIIIALIILTIGFSCLVYANGNDSFNINEGSASGLPNGVSYSSGMYTIGIGANDKTITVTGSVDDDGVVETSNVIKIEDDVANLTLVLDGININSSDKSAISLEGNAEVKILLSEETVNSLNYKNGGNGAYRTAGLLVSNGAKLTIEGQGELKAKGGSFTAGIGGNDKGSGGEINIKGGFITAEGGGSGAGIGGGRGGDGGNITISGGEITVKSRESGAGIGSGSLGTRSNITIEGGSITATGGKFGAGIGGGSSSNEIVITIKGGTIKEARGGHSAAGIGGGYGISTGVEKIEISGGNITAKGGDTGSGIGGGKGNTVGEIIISSGVIRTEGGGWGAGIGGSEQGSGGKTTISGDAIIEAKGGNYAAGIGAGSLGTDGGEITIKGGNIITTGGEWGAGIGGGQRGSGGNITIEGGNIIATGGNYAAGIGGGYGYSLSGDQGSGGTIAISGDDAIVSAIGNSGAGIGGGHTAPGGKITIQGTAKVKAISIGNPIMKPAIEAIAGSSGTIINAKLDSNMETDVYLALHSDKNSSLKLPKNYKAFAFSSAEASKIFVYSDEELNIVIGKIVLVSDDSDYITITDLGTNPTVTMEVEFSTELVTYAFNAPDAVTQNGVEATITFDKASPVGAGTKVTATVTLTGTAIKAGTHTIDLTSTKAKLTTDSRPVDVTAGQDLTASPIVNTFNITMPAEDVDDLTLTHTFKVQAQAPEFVSAETSTDGKTVILHFDMKMADPSACINNFQIKVGDTAATIESLALGSVPKTIELTLQNAVAHGQTVTVSLPPNGGCIKSEEGASMVSFSDKPVTNNVPKPDKGTSSPRPAKPSKPTYTAEVTTGDTSEPSVPVTVDSESGSASADIEDGQVQEGDTTVSMPGIPGITTYTVGIPVPDISTEDGQNTLTVETVNGTIAVPSNMLTGLDGIDGDKAQLSIGEGDKQALPDDVRQAVGDRPLVQLGLSIDGRKTAWNNPDASVTLSIPYIPTAEELENPEAIVVWYIDNEGNAFAVPNGRFDEATGMVTFRTTHFSHFGVAFNDVYFNDVPASEWYEGAVNFIAARDITKGTGQGNFSPEAKLTRSEFIVLLMKAYEMQADVEWKDNFADAGNTWYTGYLAAAKRLGIADGVGDNRYAPLRTISRQEMFTLVYNMLTRINQLPERDTGKTVKDFADGTSVAPWAKKALDALVSSGTVAGSGGKLKPTDTTTRAEMAQILRNLLISL